MPRIIAATLLALLSCATIAQPAPDSAAQPADAEVAAPVDEQAPATPDAPVGTVAESSDEGFAVGNFELNNAGDLAVICGLSAEHPDYITARTFCIGYVTGAMNYYRAIANGPGMGAFLCSDRPIPRSTLITAFVEWSDAHPQMAAAPAIENLMRAAAAKWPCG